MALVFHHDRGGVVVFYHEAEHLALEELCLHGPIVASFQLETWWKWCNAVGCYVAPIYESTTEDVIVTIIRRPQGVKMLADGNFNAYLSRSEGTTREEDISTALAAAIIAVVQAVLIYGSETWVMPPRIGRTLGERVPTIGWYRDWRGGCCSGTYMGRGSTLTWRRQCLRQACRRCRPMLPAFITPSKNLSQQVPLWTCVWRRRGVQYIGYWIGGGNRID